MNKNRVESFSDGVFSIVMTILILDIKLPAAATQMTDAELWAQFANIWPLLVTYFVSFAVLSVLWINHHFLFHRVVKSVDRWLNLLNLAYLMFIAFVPFAAYFVGAYPTHQPAVLIYGVNLLIIVLLSLAMVSYVRKSERKLLSDEVSERLLNQSRMRSLMSLTCYVLGVLVSFVFVPLSLFFFAFPIIFNIIPGTLDLTERLLGFDLGERTAERF